MSDKKLTDNKTNGLISNIVQYLMEHLYKAVYDPEYETTDERMVRECYGTDGK